MGLGANLGNPRRALERALARLADLLTDLRVSSLYRTEPVGGPAQPDYLNAVAVGRTRRAPHELLDALLAIEADEGRVRDERTRDAPRTLDLDLLLYGARRIRTRRLVVPHPRLARRRFALAPLAEIAPRRVVPGTRKTTARLLAAAPAARVTRAGALRLPGVSARAGSGG